MIGKRKWWEEGKSVRLDQTETAIRELADEQGGARRQIDALFSLDSTQGREIAQLKAAVSLLFDLVLEKGLIDEATLTARLAEAITTLTADLPRADLPRADLPRADLPRADLPARAADDASGEPLVIAPSNEH